ncbi:MAG: hypothetical protein ACXW3Y_09460 [Rhodoplanes sp.]
MPIFEITQDRLIPLQPTGFSTHGLRERADLQRLLRDQVEVIAPDVLVVSEEFGGWEDSRRRIDLLGLDREANLVVIELKRTEDGGHMELQAIRYAAMVSKMTFDKVADVLAAHLAAQERQENARELLLDFLGWDTPDEERFAQDVRIVLASVEFSRELTSAVLWLNEHGLDIRCVRLRPHTDGTRIFMDVQQILPLPEASEYFVNLREKKAEERQARRRESQWSGLWFVNVGMDDADLELVDEAGRGYIRHWLHCVRHGYVAAGGGSRYSGPLKKLEIGAEIMAYQKGEGYVGYGVVTQSAQPIHLFRLADGTTLTKALNQPDYNERLPEEKWEYAVGVQWKKHFELRDAKTFKGVFANQNVVCKLSDAATVQFVREEFEITSDNANVGSTG